MSPLEFALLALATWRLSAMLSYERGPANVFVWLRLGLGIEAGEDGEPLSWDHTQLLPSLFVCVWCLSIWVAALWCLLWLIWPAGALAVAVPFALSAVAVIVERMVH